MRWRVMTSMAACLALIVTERSLGQEMDHDQIRARIDSALAARATAPKTRGITLGDGREYNAPLYAEPSTTSQPSSPATLAVDTNEPAPTSVANFRIQFAFGSADLEASALPTLKEMAQALSPPDYDGLVFRLVGHTDAAGSKSDNLILSKRRAEAVVSYLVRHGVPRDRLRAVGKGESQLLRPDAPLADVNRRVELQIS